MQLVKYTPQHEEYFLKVYNESFPEYERRPFKKILKASTAGQIEMFVLEHHFKNVGIVTAFLDGDYVLIEYFAIDKEFRGGGFGALALQQILLRYQNHTMFLEIEYPEFSADNNIQRLRRKMFYLTNGMYAVDYHINLFGTHMEILTNGQPFQQNKAHALYKKLFKWRTNKTIKWLKNQWHQTFEIDIDKLQPLVYQASKKQIETQSYNPATGIKPVSVRVYGGHICVTEGHLRALLALSQNRDRLICKLDLSKSNDKQNLQNLSDCHIHGVKSVADLLLQAELNEREKR